MKTKKYILSHDDCDHDDHYSSLLFFIFVYLVKIEISFPREPWARSLQKQLKHLLSTTELKQLEASDFTDCNDNLKSFFFEIPGSRDMMTKCTITEYNKMSMEPRVYPLEEQMGSL